MKNIVLVLVSGFLSFTAFAQQKTARISGYLPFLSDSDFVTCKIYKEGSYRVPAEFDNNPMYASIHRIAVKNHRFSLKIAVNDIHPSQFELSTPKLTKTIPKLFVEKGDNFFLDYAGSGLNIKGKGALKNQLLMEIFGMRKHFFHGDFSHFEDYVKGGQIDADAQLKLLATNKSRLPENIYESLKIRCYITFLSNTLMYVYYYGNGHYDDITRVIANTFKPIAEHYKLTLPSNNVIAYDDASLDYLGYLYKYYRSLHGDYSGNTPEGDLLGQSWFIKANYSNDTREKLLTFLLFSENRSKDLKFCFQDDLNTFKSSKWRSIVTKYCAQLAGAPAYNFSLPDSNKVVHRLSDYIGKIVVLDCWYTGCGNCRRLTPKLAMVEEHFKDNPKVVFISVSSDKDINVWKKSINGGAYTTSKREVNLYTGGVGIRHPFYNAIDFQGAPTLKLIDANGDWADSPVDCREDDGKDLIKKINNALKSIE